jgi:predicted HTH domain antitoxin
MDCSHLILPQFAPPSLWKLALQPADDTIPQDYLNQYTRDSGSPSRHTESNDMMRFLTIPYNNDLLIATGQSPETLEQEFRFMLAVKLFEVRRLSTGQAAELAGMNKLQFMDELGRLHIPVVNLADDQIQDELRDAW